MSKLENLAGQRFERLVVVSINGRASNGGAMWDCVCDCGNTTTVYASNLKRGRTYSCGCFNHEKRSEYYTSKTPIDQRGFKKLLYDYKKSAEIRDYEFHLNESDFKRITSSKCHYCNAIPLQKKYPGGKEKSEISVYLYNGIDRMDNATGYYINNCVPCCGKCNTAKGTMSYDDFIKLIRSIFINLNLE